jgi:RNA polymerase sigma-70 factor (ECF subfamily)
VPGGAGFVAASGATVRRAAGSVYDVPMPSRETSIARGTRAFGSTQWTLVLRAKGEDPSAGTRVTQLRNEALGKLIEIYWKPLYYFVRRKGHSVDDAKDLVQAFFATFLEKDFLKSVDRQKGRFRTFLLVALEHFLANEYDKQRALKRGGGRKILSLDFEDAETRYSRDPAISDTPEKLYLKKWARVLVDQTMRELEREFDAKGKAALFKAIKPHLAGGEDYERLSKQLGMTVSNVKITVHRARKRYGELLRKAVRQTVESDVEVDRELRELMDSL